MRSHMVGRPPRLSRISALGQKVLPTARIAPAFFLLAALVPALRADEIYLKNGHKISGEIVREGAREIVYDLGNGDYTLPR